MSLAGHIRAESARLAALCTACGACVQACPMTPYAEGVVEAGPPAVAFGMRDVLRDGAGTPAALAWIGACTRSGQCTPACPEGLDAAFMLRLAQWRAKGALGEPPRIPVKEDTQFSPKVKGFARLTLNEEEQREWL
ncbi:4Fe-4S dicluster domain-containing protein [Paracraurococcus lichenis]|uniref:(Fe-S)-binding protein n=1 Tax=Paracraurococcus lichenis TaxID=3064888 RepID=A0ABT9DTX5_9PROT|nr:(Fe-S)-binding protein [Paracraurococcus sp. LOR1-02]MDO9707346.1 (Fe-S)-binding protein [Paracraurococcus sp. LOR1-02]